jgi:signal transduction histidine kinase
MEAGRDQHEGIAAAEERGGELVEFAAAASHDLSTPLRLIAGYADLLADRIDARDPETAMAMDGIRKGVDRMQSLVDGLLSYARSADTGAVEPVDANEIVAETIEALRPDLQAAGADVTVGSLPTVLATPGQLHQIFQNLISNAIKFRGEEPLRIEIAAHEEPGVWHFTVADNGIGIAQRDAVRIFDLFKRSRAVRELAGTGIGLAVVKQIIERLGGGVWVESEPGEGSTFHFTVPVEMRRREDPRVQAHS